MKTLPFIAAAAFATTLTLATAQEHADAGTVILTEAGVKNLRIETVVAEPIVFEETVFALGRIEALPNNVAAVSSRISGRVVSLSAIPGERVDQGDEVVKVESRQPGNPPPTASLASPIAGIITRLDVRLGDPVEPDRALLEIIDLREVLAVARVPETYASRLAPGTVAHISIPAVGNEKVEGRLVRFGTVADRDTGTIDAVFTLANPDEKLRPGMRAEFSIVVARRENIVAIPRSALQGTPTDRFAYVKHFDLPNAFVKTPVVVGQANDRYVEIVSGLFPADEVVSRGAYSLAFAGAGSVSLKEALDAAHGHEHNADGSEMTAEQRAHADEGHEHDHDHDHEHHDHAAGGDGTLPWKILSGVLFVALVFVGFAKRKTQ